MASVTPEEQVILDTGLRRRRSRSARMKFDSDDISDRIRTFYDDDVSGRTGMINARIQRYAKYRMWAERYVEPWAGASDIALPDMLADSLRVQDTLFNAVMSVTPPVNAVATQASEDGKADLVDLVINHQLYTDLHGEKIIGDMIEDFVNDGQFTVFVPWVRSSQRISRILIFEDIPGGMVPKTYFREILESQFQPMDPPKAVDKEGWEWSLISRDGEEIKASFYTKDTNGGTNVEMVYSVVEETFNGPRPIVIDMEDVLHKWDVENLQPPSPSNPNGAGHVIIRGKVTLDEVRQLKRDGFYDLVTDEDIDKMSSIELDRTDRHSDHIKDDLQGTNSQRTKSHTSSHAELTRLLVFDRYDVDGDGLDEDVVWFYILEPGVLVKASLMSELYPASPPRRPFAEASMIPVRGRRIGIGLLEMMEGLHDASKEILDQMIDGGTLGLSPFFIYKITGSQKPENIALQPGLGIPSNNPSEDFHFPNLANNVNFSFGFNTLTVFGQMAERLTMISDLQRGQVPVGKATALRTSENIQALLAQGEARPERVLRRLFSGLSELYAQIHELNKHFLPPRKKILVSKNIDRGEDPYQEVQDRRAVSGRFAFTFKANVLNTSKSALQTALGNIMGVLAQPLALQSGIVTPDNLYNMYRDWVKANGQETRKYITPPAPDSDKPKGTAEEAIVEIIRGTMPDIIPIEGYAAHLRRLQQFLNSDDWEIVPVSSQGLFREYYSTTAELAKREEIAAAASASTTPAQPATEGATTGSGATGNQMLSPNEMLNEALPGG